MIDKEHAVDVVNLVLQAGRQETLGINLVLLAAQIEEFDLDLGRPLDFLVIIRNRQTAFLELGAFVRLPGDFGINEHLRLVIVLFFDRSMVITRLATPTWIAARPMPGALYIVSNMSSTSLRIPTSICLTGSESSRSRLSGSLIMSRTAMAEM